MLVDPDAPPCENEEEIITDVTLTFTPVGEGEVVTATATDPDGEGVLPLAPDGPINLLESTEYILTMSLFNSIEGEDITEEINEEDDEHLFLFEFTDEIFASPAGDGNRDNRNDPINYLDMDENGLPVGLETAWTTECGQEVTSGNFRVILKHQPGEKDENSGFEVGGTDLDIDWDINVLVDPDAPPCENEEEIITDVVLTFISRGGGDTLVARAVDPDGSGVLSLEPEGEISLAPNASYDLFITLTNSIEGEDVTEEINEEDDEHLFLFEWTEGFFTSPEGNGNRDNRNDPVNYEDEDENGLPVGLATSWTTAETPLSGTFRVILKHQPGEKDENSGFDVGGTDVDIEWVINNSFVTSNNNISVNTTSLRVSPNPVNSTLNWQLDQNLGNVERLIIYDTFGRLVKTFTNNNQMLDVSDLNGGIYILTVEGEREIFMTRFVKE